MKKYKMKMGDLGFEEVTVENLSGGEDILPPPQKGKDVGLEVNNPPPLPVVDNTGNILTNNPLITAGIVIILILLLNKK